jgi:hypothetical protein
VTVDAPGWFIFRLARVCGGSIGEKRGSSRERDDTETEVVALSV